MKNRTKVMVVSASMSLLLTTGLIVREEMGSHLIRGMHAEAATISYYKTTANLHMRTGASTKKSIIITIPKGKQVTYLSKSGSWFKVKYQSKTGYVSSSYLKKVQVGSTTPSAAKTIYATTSNLNLRSTPSTKGKVLLTIPKGKEVSYITKNGSWFKVKYQSKTGFVSSKYIKKTTKKTLTPTTSVKTTKITPTTFQTKANLHMRSSASAKGKLLLTIPKDKKLIAKEKSGDWYKVSYNGRTGWVNAGYLKEYDRYSTTAVTYYSTRKSAGIYDNPNVKKKQTYTLPKDYSLTSTQKVVNSTGQTWYRVIYKKKNYFILSSDVTHKKASSMKKASYKSIQGTNLYSSAGTAHSKLASIAKGTIITATYRIGDWYEITHAGKKGYVMRKHFEEYKPTVSEIRPEGQATKESIYYVIADKPLHLRESNSTSSAVLDEIATHTAVRSAYKTKNGWFEVTYKDKKGYVSGQYLITKAEYDRYKTLVNTKNSYLTLDLRTQSSVTAAQIDRYIDGYVKRTGRESVLANKGQAIVNAGKEYGVNALYLAAHAVHESGYGTSAISLAKKNLFGFGAYDVAPFVGAIRFSSIEENINYIAREIKATYLTEGNWKHKGPTLGFTIKNVNGDRVDSLSTGMNFYYASDSGWGAKIASHMNNILAYGNEKAVSRTPNTKSVIAPARPNGKDEFPSGILATAKTSIKLYAAKGSIKTSVVTIEGGEKFYLLEKWNDNWLKIQYKGKVYYTNVISLSSYHHFMTVYNLAHITTNLLNVRSNAGTSYSKVGTLSDYTYVELMLNNENKPITKNGWYQVKLSTGKTGWVSGTYIARDLNK